MTATATQVPRSTPLSRAAIQRRYRERQRNHQTTDAMIVSVAEALRFEIQTQAGREPLADKVGSISTVQTLEKLLLEFQRRNVTLKRKPRAKQPRK